MHVGNKVGTLSAEVEETEQREPEKHDDILSHPRQAGSGIAAKRFISEFRAKKRVCSVVICIAPCSSSITGRSNKCARSLSRGLANVRYAGLRYIWGGLSSSKLPRMVEGFAKVVKYALFLANCLILICGISVFAVGVWILADRAFMERLLGSDLYVTSASILVATGVIVTLISFLGCFGAIKEIKCMLLTFFIILFMIFIVMLVGGILGYVFRNEVEKQMHQEMVTSVPKYGEETAVTDAWDSVQEFFKCCGVTVDYEKSYAIWRKSNKRFKDRESVPDSCCKEKQRLDVCQSDPPNQAYTTDCYIKMKDFVKDHALILGGVGIGISCVLIVGMMLSCALFLMIN